MKQYSLSICSRCRHDLFRLNLEKKTFARTRSSVASTPPKTPFSKPRPAPNVPNYGSARFGRPQAARPPPPTVTERPMFTLTPDGLGKYLAENVQKWRQDPRVHNRLCAFGIERNDIKPILSAFASAVKREELLGVLDYDQETVARIVHDLSHTASSDILDQYLTKLLFEWADLPAGQAILDSLVSPSTVTKMSTLFQAADLSCPASWYATVRAAKPRKVIMHVGPTNSGKTHNALRALAAARRGVYAGPLRLLAHEIWERLNKGQIVPLGAELETDAEPDPDSNLDLGDAAPIIRKEGSSKYARPCNMITGEEQKIVQEYALLSCTVEMVPTSVDFDVAVVDEIQMIADSDRGGAWTNAVLGINTTELHLCGEETAVPLIERMLRDTGDELIVNRYERLTPLNVAKHSLKGDLSHVQKGDCFVTFSRRQLFASKKRIEQLTGMRCAVAYGRLPPEIRSEQAALFNKPGSGYDVLVGSDAIGMGLNLKIKRVVFEAVRKYDGFREAQLSNSQIKQIAGRAGRYGMHEKDSAGGLVTTLDEADLNIVRKALKAPPVPIRYARISLTGISFTSIMRALPIDASSQTGAEVYQYVSKMHPYYTFQDIRTVKGAMLFVDAIADDITIRDRMMLQMAPTPFRDLKAADAIRCIMQFYQREMRVGLREALEVSGLLPQYEDIIRKLNDSLPMGDLSETLATLETVHKVLVLYLWLSYRHQVGFPDQQVAFAMRDEAENAMDSCLEALTARSAGDRANGNNSRRDRPRYKAGNAKDFQQQGKPKYIGRPFPPNPKFKHAAPIATP